MNKDLWIFSSTRQTLLFFALTLSASLLTLFNFCGLLHCWHIRAIVQHKMLIYVTQLFHATYALQSKHKF